MQYVYVKDGFKPENEASISIEERGFRFGDGVFETIRVRGGRPYQWHWHMQRMADGLNAVLIDFDTTTLAPLCDELLAKNNVSEGALRIYVSRGIGSRGYLPDAGIQPTLIIQTMPLPQLNSSPVALWLSSMVKPSLAALPVGFKLAQGMNSTLARIEAQQHDCAEALLLDGNGRLCEAASANLFWLEGKSLCTPALSTGALAGSTRAAIKRLSPWPVREVVAPLAALARADAVCITNAMFGAIAVGLLKPVNWQWQSEEMAETLNALLANDTSDTPYVSVA